MKPVTLALVIALVLLQARLWLGDGSIMQVRTLKKEVALQQETITKLKERNQMLEAEVLDLKHQSGALEERARTDLGMIRQGETFFQFSPEDSS